MREDTAAACLHSRVCRMCSLVVVVVVLLLLLLILLVCMLSNQALAIPWHIQLVVKAGRACRVVMLQRLLRLSPARCVNCTGFRGREVIASTQGHVGRLVRATGPGGVL